MADLDLKNLNFEHWWTMVAAAGAAIAVASVAVKFAPTIFVGLGAMAFGVGEWINHPYREAIDFPYKISGHPRSPNIGGLLLDGIGILLAVIGLIKLAFA